MGPSESSWDLPIRMGIVVLEEVGHAGRRLGLQAMLLQEGAQNEVPGKGHFFSKGKKKKIYRLTDAQNYAIGGLSPLTPILPTLSQLKPSSAFPHPAPPPTNPAACWRRAPGQVTLPLCSPSYILHSGIWR